MKQDLNMCHAMTMLEHITLYDAEAKDHLFTAKVQWLKKLFQCLAVSYYLTCNTMISGGITLKQIHLIVYYISF